MTYHKSSLPNLLQGATSTLSPFFPAYLSNPTTTPLLLIISLSALLVLLSTIITLLIWIRLLVGVSLCITVLVAVGKGFAGEVTGVSVDELVGKGMSAAAGVMSVVVGMDESSDAIMRRPSRALKRIR